MADVLDFPRKRGAHHWKPKTQNKAANLPIVDVAEIRRLHAKGVGVTAIAALLRVPYREVRRVITPLA